MAAKVDPYKQYANAYNAQQNAIKAANTAQVQERQQREQKAQQTLESNNRGVYTSYQNAINPFGSFASQNNYSTGVTDYARNAAYGNMLKGLGANQQNYNEAMNNSNALWNNWVAQKAGQEADNLGDYASRLVAQANADREYDRGVFESDRSYNYQLGRDKILDARDERDYNRSVLESDRDYGMRKDQFDWQKTTDERDYNRSVLESDRDYNYQVGRDSKTDEQWEKEFNARYGNTGSSGKSSGGSKKKGSPKADDGLEVANPTGDPRIDHPEWYDENGKLKNIWDKNNNPDKVVKTYYEPSATKGYQYRVYQFADGSTSKVMVKK